jgi:hypothetical protein
MNAGNPLTQRTLDTLDLIGIVPQGLTDQQKNTLGSEAISLFRQGRVEAVAMATGPPHCNIIIL